MTTIPSSSLPSQHVPAPARRQILSYASNRTASVQAEGAELNTDDVVQHAFQRILCAYTALLSLHNTGTTSSGTLENLEVWVDHADMQGGKGTGGLHAAHSWMAAGLKDNCRDLYIQEINENKELTPKKKRILKTKGFSEDDLDTLIACSDKIELVKAVFDRVWNQPSLLHDTRLYQRLQMTFALPKELNLQVDGRLEKAKRPFVAELFKKCMKGEERPEEACNRLVVVIQTHFRQAIDDLTKKVELIGKFEEKLRCYRVASVKMLKTTHRARQLLLQREQKNILFQLRVIKAKLSKRTDGAPALQMTQTATFLRASPFPSRNVLNGLREELGLNKAKYLRLRSFCELELQGTHQPDYAKVTGKLCPETGTPSLLLTPERSPLKHRMLAPITPEGDKARKILFRRDQDLDF